MTEIFDGKPAKRPGRPPGAPNKITRDIRAALRDLAEGNADRAQAWLDSVAERDPAEALRLWLALLRFTTPTLQAGAIADVTAHQSTKLQIARMTDEQLMEVIVNSQEAAELVKQGVKTKEELLRGLSESPRANALSTAPHGLLKTDPSLPNDDELLQ